MTCKNARFNRILGGVLKSPLSLASVPRCRSVYTSFWSRFGPYNKNTREGNSLVGWRNLTCCAIFKDLRVPEMSTDLMFNSQIYYCIQLLLLIIDIFVFIVGHLYWREREKELLPIVPYIICLCDFAKFYLKIYFKIFMATF